MGSAPAVYRQLLRAVNTAFRNDSVAITSARTEIRTKFQESAGVKDPHTLQELYAAGAETAEFIRTCVVQGSATDSGRIGVKLEAHHAGGVLEPPQAAVTTARPNDPDACYTG